MLNQRLLRTVDEATGATCTTDTVNILSGSAGATSIVTYPMDGNSDVLTDSSTTLSNVSRYIFDSNANDSSGNGYNGTENNITYAAGNFGNAAVFNGTNGYVSGLNGIIPSSTNSDCSFSCWFSMGASFSSNYKAILGGTGVDAMRVLLRAGGNGYRIEVSRGENGVFYYASSTSFQGANLSLNAFYHLVATFTTSNKTARVYLNGSLIDTVVLDTPYTDTINTNLALGTYRADVGFSYFNGKIDQVRTFDTALPQSAVTELYNETSTTASSNSISYDSPFNGTDSNVTYAAGNFGNAAVFNGSSSIISVSGQLPSVASDYSISFWANPTTISTSGNTIFTNINAGGSAVKGQVSVLFYDYNSVKRLRVYIVTTTGSLATAVYDSTSAISTGTFSHIVVNIDINGAPTAYVDGSPFSMPFLANTSVITQGSDTIFGKHQNASFFNGSIDQIRIFDTAISASTALDLYNEGAATTEFTESLPSTVAYYKMSDATDETGSYDGTPTNVDFNVEGKFGNAGSFSGSGSYIDTNYTLPASSTCSVSAWFKTSATNIQQFVLADFDSVGSASSVRFTLGFTAANNWYFSLGNGSSNWSSYTINALPYRDGNWHNIVTVWNGTSVKLYADGNTTPIVDLTSSFSFGTAGTSPLIIGRAGGYSGNYWNGLIDNIRIFNKAITEEDVETLYNEVYCQPTIVPTDYFEPVIYTGNGGTKSITSLDFTPDLVWVKSRSEVNLHVLTDSVRGTDKQLFTDLTDAESTNTNRVTSFDSNGFTLGTQATFNRVNSNGINYVAWNWKAGGADVLNEEGTIDSQVSASVDSGFSIVKYTGNGSSSQQSYGHGLSSAPELLITKNMDAATQGTNSWVVGGTLLGNGGYIFLNLTNAKSTASSYNGNQVPDSQVIYTSGTSDLVGNQNGVDFITYAFHSVDGFSKIGSYISTSPISSTVRDIYLGFTPAFVMIKNLSTSGAGWNIYDNKRPDATSGSNIFANSSSAEADYSSVFEMSSTGFKLKSINTNTHYQANHFIFMAFAEEIAPLIP
jgi:hypothetical protein